MYFVTFMLTDTLSFGFQSVFIFYLSLASLMHLHPSSYYSCGRISITFHITLIACILCSTDVTYIIEFSHKNFYCAILYIKALKESATQLINCFSVVNPSLCIVISFHEDLDLSTIAIPEANANATALFHHRACLLGMY